MQNSISIIIPTYNEAKYIGKCLDSIFVALKDTHIPHEIIVVNNLSTDNTEDIVKAYPVNYLISSKKGNPSATRNLGASKAQYDILCFIDGDCLVTADWFHQILKSFEDEMVGAYGGPALSPENGNWIERTWAPTQIKPFLLTKSALPGANFSIRRKLFNDLNGFNESLITAEDDDLARRVMQHKFNSVSDSNHPVIHLGYPQSLAEIYKKQIWHGSSQLKAHGLTGDKMVLLTIVWLSAFAVLIPSFYISNVVFYLGILTITLCPLLVAFKRLEKFLQYTHLTLVRAYIICWFFLSGRAHGLIKEITSRKH